MPRPALPPLPAPPPNNRVASLCHKFCRQKRINDAFAATSSAANSVHFCCIEQADLPSLFATAQSELLRLKAEKTLKKPDNLPLIQLGLVIGPEGGFSPREVALLSGLSSARLVSLGKEILRTETASLVGLSLLKALIPHILTQE